jgi:hypothetical protein
MARNAPEQTYWATARRTQPRLQQALKTAQKRKKIGLKVIAKAASKKRVVADAQSSREGAGATAGGPPSQSQHGRAIKLPAKYR